ncbi:MAG: FG-GAP repeat protein [Dokdonella sp.]
MTLHNVCLALAIPFTSLALASNVAAAAPASQSPLSTDEAEALRASARQSYLEEFASTPPAAYGSERSATDSPLVPLVWIEQRTRVTDGSGFGSSIAVSGNVAFVGAFSTNSYQGAVYVFQRAARCLSTVCPWTQKQRLVASDGAPGAVFGGSVAFDGTTALVGARSTTVDGHQNQGAVYVFTRDSSLNFVQAQKLTAADGLAEDCFGGSVAVTGSDALVGAPFCSGTNYVLNGHGSAYRYNRDVNGLWTVAQKFVASDGGFAESFGSAVAISADTAIIGASSAFQFGHYGVGGVYVYRKQCFSNGCNPGWMEKQKLVGTPTSTGMEFGGSIAYDGTHLLVGSEWALTGDPNLPLQLTAGAVYAFTQTNGEWVQQQQLLASDSYRNWRFGASVTLNGSTAVVGATGVGWPNVVTGAAYVFALNNDVWGEVQKLSASDGASNDYFGNAVGVSNEGYVLVGAPLSVNSGGQGTLYVYKQQ